MTPTAPSAPDPDRRLRWTLLGALLLPLLLSHAPLPNPAFYKDLLALLGAGALLLLAGRHPALSGALAGRPGPGAGAVLRAVALLLLAMAGSVAFTGALPGQAATHAAALGTAALLLLLGRALGAAAAGTGAGADRAAGLRTLVWQALLAAALINALVGVAQLHAPAVFDTLGIAGAPRGGRAVGLLRQANNFATLCVWGLAAAGALALAGRLRPAALLGAVLVLVLGVVESGSRTGLIGLGFITLWALLDRRLPPALRLPLLAVLPLAGLLWALTPWLAELAATTRVGGAQASLSSPRWPLWRNALTLIAGQPLLGVGWGNFNFAWTLTPLAERPAYAFTHAHNILLHWAVEIGLPLTLAVAGLLLAAWVRALRGLAGAGDAADRGSRTAGLLVVAMAGLHSLTEFPLWYPHLLLPMALAWGLALAGEGAGQDPAPSGSAAPGRAGPGVAAGRTARALPGLLSAWGAGLIVAALLAWRSFLPVLDLLAPSDPRQTAEERALIAGQSWYAPEWGLRLQGTLAPHGQRTLAPYAAGATRFQLDGRLLLAWALTHQERGDTDRAWYLAQRIRELGGPVARNLFAHCEPAAAPPPAEPPRRPPPTFQCGQRTVALGWRDFL